MKILKRILFAIYSMVTITFLIMGLYMAINYFNKDERMFFFYLAMFIAGVVLLVSYAVIILVKKKLANKPLKEPKKDKYY